MSFLNKIITALPATLRSTSPTSIGLSPGFLFSKATDDSKDDGDSSSATHKFLISWANVLRKFYFVVPKAREVKILRQPSASRLDSPDPPFVNIETFIITDSSISSYATIWIGLVGPYINTSGKGSLGSFLDFHSSLEYHCRCYCCCYWYCHCCHRWLLLFGCCYWLCFFFGRNLNGVVSHDSYGFNLHFLQCSHFWFVDMLMMQIYFDFHPWHEVTSSKCLFCVSSWYSTF